MRITPEQIAILNSFRVTRLKADDSLLRDVSAFENPKNENLVEYLVGNAFDDDDKNRCACYVVRDDDGEILCYFSIKCGLLYSEFEELKKFEKFKNHKIKLMELEQRSDDAQVQEYIEDIKKKLQAAKDDIERLLGKFDSMPPNKQVAKSFPSVELTHFCVNGAYRKKWQTYGFSSRNRIGSTMFWHVIVGIVEKIRNLIGCEYLYLFAADATSDRHLVFALQPEHTSNRSNQGQPEHTSNQSNQDNQSIHPTRATRTTRCGFYPSCYKKFWLFLVVLV